MLIKDEKYLCTMSEQNFFVPLKLFPFVRSDKNDKFVQAFIRRNVFSIFPNSHTNLSPQEESHEKNWLNLNKEEFRFLRKN